MTEQYTPTTEHIEHAYVDFEHFAATVAGRYHDEDDSKAEFRAWLAAHDAEVAANALREAANECPPRTTMSTLTVRKHLRDRADRIEREATNHKPNPELGSSEGSGS